MSLPCKTGVELELWVVDEDGRPCDGQDLADVHARIDPEFVAPLLEVKTEPRETEAGLRRDLQEVLGVAIRAARATDRRLVPLGTPLTTVARPAEDERGQLFEAIYGDGVASAKNCAGTHVHFERANTRRQLDVLTALDPALSLVSSSPYYRGERMADSSRALAYRKACGDEFRRYCDLWRYAESVEEWHSRVQNAYGVFESLAERRGVSRDRVAEHFDPEDTVLNPVRLREPTVEWRAPDSALPSQVVRLATDVGRIVAATDSKPVDRGADWGVREDRITVPSFPELRELSRRAITAGLESDPVNYYLRRMGLDPDSYRPTSPRIEDGPTIDSSTARALRLERARQLEADVETLTEKPDEGLGRLQRA